MIIPPAIFGVGRNYALHASEMHAEPSCTPVIFMKNPASLLANGQSILIPACCNEEEQVDFEGELAILIKDDCRNILIEHAYDYVDGYAVANDVTERKWQKEGSGGQWVRGKSFDTFCPLTSFVSADSVADPHTLSIQTLLNGETMQQANTSEMIFSIPQLLTELSRDMTILKGTIILTGTPAGVGFARTPQIFLREGDLIEVIIEGVGHLKNTVLRAI